jgi:hypothetical protein
LLAALLSSIRTFTVGSGFSPDLLTSSNGSARGLPSLTWDTAGGDFHPALRISQCYITCNYYKYLSAGELEVLQKNYKKGSKKGRLKISQFQGSLYGSYLEEG